MEEKQRFTPYQQKILDQMETDEFKETAEEYVKNIKVRELPEGWISIEDHLPYMRAVDFMTGTLYKVKTFLGEEGYSRVGDHNCWYYDAKEAGITHWWNGEIEEK